MKIPGETVPSTYDVPHEVIGRYIVLCSMLDYRLSQLLSRWFTPKSRLKFLSNVIHSIEPARKREIIRERLSAHHPAGREIIGLIDDVEKVLSRRDLAVHGVLSSTGDGGYVLKNLASHRALSLESDPDQLRVEDIPTWSQEAMRLTSEVVRLSQHSTPKGLLAGSGLVA